MEHSKLCHRVCGSCEINFENIEQACGDDGTIDLSFNIIIDFPNQNSCVISKIEIVHGAVIGQPPLDDPSTLSIENFSPDDTYTITGAIPGHVNCYHINLIDEEGNVCCYTMTCVDDIECCELEVDIRTTCAPDGIVIVEIQNGSPPFTVYGANLASSDDPYTYEDSDLDAGTYDLSITDSNGCTFETTYTIFDEGSEECCDLQVDIRTTCAPPGNLVVEINNGSAPFTVSGADLPDPDFPNIYEASDLEAGTYDLSITDSNGCTFETTYTILENDLEVDWVFRGCSPDGYIAVTVGGGSEMYHVIGAAQTDSDDPFYYEEEALDPGTYPLIVTDLGTGCVLSTTYTVPEPLSIADIEWDIEDCEIIVTLAGGTPDYTLLTGSDSGTENPFVIYVGEASDISFLSEPIIFQDANGCRVSFIPLDIKDIPKEIIECHAEGGPRFTITDQRSKIDHEESSAHKIELFPSPVSDVLEVSILDDLNNFTVLSIIDDTGKTLMTKNLLDQKRLSLDTSSIPSGIYFLQLSSKDGNPIVKRFVKN